MKKQPEEISQQLINVINKLTLVGNGINEIIIGEPGLDGAKTIILECIKELNEVKKEICEEN